MFHAIFLLLLSVENPGELIHMSSGSSWLDVAVTSMLQIQGGHSKQDSVSKQGSTQLLF